MADYKNGAAVTEKHDNTLKHISSPSSLEAQARDLKSKSAMDIAVQPEPSHVTDQRSNHWQGEMDWNKPRINMLRVAISSFGFVIMGMEDGSLGALIPSLETYYNLNYTKVSLLFLPGCAGYVFAALITQRFCRLHGIRGSISLGAVSRLITYIAIACHPPFAVVVFVLVFSGFGHGLEDVVWNSWYGKLNSVNQLMGVLHGFYGVGATLGPALVSILISKAHKMWYEFFYILIALAAFELFVGVAAFWTENGAKFRLDNAVAGDDADAAASPTTDNTTASGDDGILATIPVEKPSTATLPKRGTLKEAVTSPLSRRPAWLFGAFGICLVGVEMALGGWIPSYMINVRHAGLFPAGMASTGYWLGLTIGRFILGFVTPHIGERLAVAIYFPIIISLVFVIWFVPSFYANAVAMGFQGFFIGPMFPTVVVVVQQLLPRHLLLPVISTSIALSKIGGTAFPFAVGAIAQHAGVKVLQPITLAGLVLLETLWLFLCSSKSHNPDYKAQQKNRKAMAAVADDKEA